MSRATTTAPFVVITPARNEEALIDGVIESMLAQRVRPLRWIVVDDNSSDRTAEIVARHAARHDFMRLVRMRRSGERHFGKKAEAFAAGVAAIDTPDYRYIGNLDADISLPPDYYERILEALDAQPRLGIAGGMVCTRIGDRFISQNVALDSVAGAVQLFRRACFEQVGGYRALPDGGIDSAAEIMARMKGWQVRTLPELRVLEHRRTGSATARPLSSKFREGQRLHSLGYGLLFMCLRCLYRSADRPRAIGSVAALFGYLQRALRGRPAALPPEVVRYLRREQRRKLIESLRRPHVWHLRDL